MTPYCFSYINNKKDGKKGGREGGREGRREGRREDQNPRPYFIKGSYI